MNEPKDKNLEKLFSKKVEEHELERAVNRSDDVLRKVEGGFIKKELAKVKLLVMMLKDYWDGKYSAIPWHIIAGGVITILYILNPMDFVPDFIPAAGQLDDFAVLAFFWNMASEDIKEYALWKIGSGNKEVVELYERAFAS